MRFQKQINQEKYDVLAIIYKLFTQSYGRYSHAIIDIIINSHQSTVPYITLLHYILITFC